MSAHSCTRSLWLQRGIRLVAATALAVILVVHILRTGIWVASIWIRPIRTRTRPSTSDLLHREGLICCVILMNAGSSMYVAVSPCVSSTSSWRSHTCGHNFCEQKQPRPPPRSCCHIFLHACCVLWESLLHRYLHMCLALRCICQTCWTHTHVNFCL